MTAWGLLGDASRPAGLSSGLVHVQSFLPELSGLLFPGTSLVPPQGERRSLHKVFADVAE